MQLMVPNGLSKGYGVDPDIVVDNDPAKEYAGEDQQLDRAIQHILQELRTKRQGIAECTGISAKELE